MNQELQKHLHSLLLAGEYEIPLLKQKSKTQPENLIQEQAVKKESTDMKDLEQLKEYLSDCSLCPLAAERTNVVFGEGNPKAKLMFVGEGPGRDEDLQGRPFIGRAGKLLTKMIEAMGITREEIYIANVVKCRPPNNRNPEPIEIQKCSPFLSQQIHRIQPKVIIGLGKFAVQTLLATEEKISSLRGNWKSWPNEKYKTLYDSSLEEGSIKFMPTYHPAYLLRNPSQKKVVWEDLQLVMKELGLKT